MLKTILLQLCISSLVRKLRPKLIHWIGPTQLRQPRAAAPLQGEPRQGGDGHPNPGNGHRVADHVLVIFLLMPHSGFVWTELINKRNKSLSWEVTVTAVWRHCACQCETAALPCLFLRFRLRSIEMPPGSDFCLRIYFTLTNGINVCL
jgi:hypothetical protein